jgi:hypothetical protein
MSIDPPPLPPDPDPGFEPVEEAYQFADELGPLPPPAEPPAPAEEAPAPRRKKRRPQPTGEVAEEHRDRILDREDEPPPVAWWVAPVILIVVGFLLCLIPVVLVASEKGAAVGLKAAAVALVGVPVQVIAVTALLVVIGQFFGIDYGPALHAVVKLAAVVVIVDGLTAALAVGCTPLGLMMAAIIGAGVFQYLFRLAIHEMLLSVAGMVLAAFLLNAYALRLLVTRG